MSANVVEQLRSLARSFDEFVGEVTADEVTGEHTNDEGRARRWTQVAAAVIVLALVGGLAALMQQRDASGPASNPTTTQVATQPTTVLPDTATGNLPGTTLLAVPTRNDALVASAVPMQVTEPCPPSSSGAGSDQMIGESAHLEPMLGQVLAYGGEHPDEFGAYGFIWHDGGDASVFISFTSNLDTHRASLQGLVAYPDELIVCQVAVSGEVSRALMAKLSDELEGRYMSVVIGMGAVEVALKPGEDALAAELVEAYGAAVNVEVCPTIEACAVPML